MRVHEIQCIPNKYFSPQYNDFCILLLLVPLFLLPLQSLLPCLIVQLQTLQLTKQKQHEQNPATTYNKASSLYNYEYKYVMK